MNGKTKTYEGMFLLDVGVADFEAAAEPVRDVLGRGDAELLAIKPWDERRLAYEIKGRRRGLYILTYFKADPARIVEIEHECLLNERILRALILRRDKLTEETINAATPATSDSRRPREARPERGEDRPAAATTEAGGEKPGEPKPSAEAKPESVKEAAAEAPAPEPAPEPTPEPAPEPAPAPEPEPPAEAPAEEETKPE